MTEEKCISIEELFADATSSIAQPVLQFVEHIAKLPLTFTTRLALGMEEKWRQQAYLDNVNELGGGCLDKALLCQQGLEKLGIETSLVLGGFGGSGFFDQATISDALKRGESSDQFSQTQHLAVLATFEDGQWLIDASGGRVGCLLAPPYLADSLLQGQSAVKCANLGPMLYYHRAQPNFIDEVIQDKFSPKTTYHVVRRAALIIEGNYTVHLITKEPTEPTKRFQDRIYYSIGSLVEDGPQLLALARPKIIESALETLKRCNVPYAGAQFKFLVKKADQKWGEGTQLIYTA